MRTSEKIQKRRRTSKEKILFKDLNSEDRSSLFQKIKENLNEVVVSYDQVNVRIPAEMNDWLNKIVRDSKKFHGTKIFKEAIIEAAIFHLQNNSDIEWEKMKSKEDILKALGYSD